MQNDQVQKYIQIYRLETVLTVASPNRIGDSGQQCLFQLAGLRGAKKVLVKGPPRPDPVKRRPPTACCFYLMGVAVPSGLYIRYIRFLKKVLRVFDWEITRCGKLTFSLHTFLQKKQLNRLSQIRVTGILRVLVGGRSFRESIRI